MRSWLVNISRLLLGAVFILSGFVKAVDPLGTQYKLNDYLAALNMGKFIPDWATLGAAVLLAALEFCMGLFLLFGVRKQMTSRVTLLMLVIMTPLTLWLALADPIHDCGCFGDALVLTNWQTFFKNVVLLTMALVVAYQPERMFRLVSESSQWLVTNYSAVFILAVSGYCLYDLPLFDFRPYRVGTDLRAGWTKTMEGEDLPYTDLFLESADDGTDLTEELLSDTSYVMLLVAPYLEQADDSRFDLLNELNEYAREQGYAFYGVTASNAIAISRWREGTGAEYPFCQADDIVLKTMIRSNPGLILLKNGKVLGKWSHNRLPVIDDTQTAQPLNELAIGQKQDDSATKKIAALLLWFVLPLLVLTVADRTWMWTRWLRRSKKNKENVSLNNKNIVKKDMRKKIVAGNWKMNMNLQDGIALAKELNETLKAEKPNCGVVICTPFIHLASIAQFLDQNIIGLGAENCADKEKGAFTGEVSAEMVKSTGAQYVILGHSERREYYKETPEILKEKVLLAQKNDLKVIFCIGESLEEREAGKQNEVVKAELEGSVFNLSEEDFRKIVIAYEPIWAIGTGKTATAEQAEEIHAYIRSIIAEKYGQAVADDTTILYGGSCKASNAPELFAKPDIDGGLIGGASLKAADFKGIIDAFK